MTPTDNNEPTATVTVREADRTVEVEQYENSVKVITPDGSVELDRPAEAEAVGLGIQTVVPKAEKQTAEPTPGGTS